MDIEDKSAYEILEVPDDMKLKSSMTLFGLAKGADTVFQNVLDQYSKAEWMKRRYTF